MRIFIAALFIMGLCITSATAQEANCEATDTSCLMAELDSIASTIEEDNWRDQTFREQAKLFTREKQSDNAIALIERIQNPDTKAMTIRGIGMAAAEIDMTQEEYDALFAVLRTEADKIEHPPSYAIALTYIAMAQAFAGDDDGAMKTAADMENDALRNKAYAESAEIQAERGSLDAAMASIAAIESASFRDKAHRLVSKIFADRQNYNEALETAMAIDNAYQKSQALLYILAKQISPEDASKNP